MADIGRLSIILEAGLAKLREDMSKAVKLSKDASEKMQKAFGGLKTALGAVGLTVGISAVVGYLNNAIDKMAELKDLSEKTGISLGAASALQDTAALSDTAVGDLISGLQKLTRSQNNAKDASSDAAKAFKAFGISAEEVKNLKVEELFLKLALNSQKFAEGGGKIPALIALMERSAGNLVPVLNDLADKGDLVGRVTDEQVLAADAYSKNLVRLKTQIQDLTQAALSDMIPGLNNVVKVMTDATKQSGLFIGVLKGLKAAGLSVFGDGTDFLNDIELVKKAIADTYSVLNARRDTGLDISKFDPSFDIIKYEERLQFLKGRLKELEGVKKKEKELEEKKPEVKFAPSSLEGKAGAAASKRLAEALKRGKELIDAEKDVYTSRADALKQYYDDDLLSIDQYFSARETIIKSNLDATIKLYAGQEKTLRAALAKAPEDDRADIEGKLKDVIADRVKAEKDAAEESTKLFFEQKSAARDFENQLKDINAQILELSGNTAGAVAIRFDIANAEQLNRLTVEGNTAALEQLATIRARTVAQAQLNDLQNDFGEITQSLSIVEQRVSIERDKGNVSELEALKLTGDARRNKVDELQRIADAYREIAAATNDAGINLQADQLQLQIDQLQGSTDELADVFDDKLKDSFGNFFNDVATGTKSIGDAFRDLGNDIFAQFTKIATNEVASKLFSGLGGGGKDGGSIGGFISSLFQFENGGIMTGAGALPLRKYANGGVANSPQLAMFGEGSKPEAYVPLPDGRSIPVNIAGGGAGGGVSVVNNFTINGQMDSRSQQQIAAQVGAAVNRATRRNG